jgi:hypothetical protein
MATQHRPILPTRYLTPGELGSSLATKRRLERSIWVEQGGQLAMGVFPVTSELPEKSLVQFVKNSRGFYLPFYTASLEYD